MEYLWIKNVGSSLSVVLLTAEKLAKKARKVDFVL